MQESRATKQEPIYEEIENEYALANQQTNHTYVLPNFTGVKKRSNRCRLFKFISIATILFILISAGVVLGVLGGSRFFCFLSELYYL